MIVECFLYSINALCTFQNGEHDFIPVLVYSKSEWKAKKIAIDFLESGKSGYKIKSVDRINFTLSNSFIADTDDKINGEWP